MSRARNLHPETLGFRLGSSAEVKNARKRRSADAKRKRRPSPVRSSPSKPVGTHDPDRLRARTRLVAIALAVGAGCVLARSAQLQIHRHDDYRVAANDQASSVRTIRAQRGPILDRHGAELAISVHVDSVFAEPRRIEHPERIAPRVASILGKDVDTVRARLEGDRAFVFLDRRVDPEVGARIRELGVRGLSTQPEPRRFYPNTGLAAHVLGFTNIDEDGKAGLERTFDETLHGGTVTVSALRDALGKRVMTEGFVPPSSLNGQGVRLTLDRQVQYATESILADTVEEHRGRAGVAVVLEVGTGDVLALASYPGFNPNNLIGSTSHDHLNRAVSAVYEPGSTMKMFTVAAALEEKVFGIHDRIDCEGGRWRVGGRTIHDTHAEEGSLTVGDVLRVSSNVCAAKIGMKLGKRRMHRWLFRFGFGEPTGIELPGEIDGLIDPVHAWRDITLANVAFGQGIAVTPLQLAQAAAVVAQDGVLVRPRIVMSTLGGDGREKSRPEPPTRRVMSVRTARRLRRMLTDVVGPDGTASRAAIEGVSVAGKTGTAQKIDPVTKAYSHELHVSSFVGMAPAESPELVVLVLVDEPQEAFYGGLVAAPAFRRIARAALTARGRFVGSALAPAAPSAEPVPPPAGESRLRERPELQSPRSEVPALDAALSAEARALLGEGPRDETSDADEPWTMPDVVGLELREVLRHCAKVRCQPRLDGTGRVVRQRPDAGSKIEPGSVWRLVAQTSGEDP